MLSRDHDCSAEPAIGETPERKIIGLTIAEATGQVIGDLASEIGKG